MEAYRIPRREVAVRILVDSGQVLEGALFAAERGLDGRPGRIVDLLNEEGEEFVALKTAEDRLLINKAGLIHVSVERGLGELERYEESAHQTSGAHLTLVGGHALVGRLVFDMPPSRSRVMDYLNAAPRFLPLLSEGRVTLVQRRCVMWVRSLTEVTEPPA